MIEYCTNLVFYLKQKIQIWKLRSRLFGRNYTVLFENGKNHKQLTEKVLGQVLLEKIDEIGKIPFSKIKLKKI